MARKYQKTKHLLKEVLELVDQGKTKREIGEIYGLSRIQVKNLIYRHHRSIRNDTELKLPQKRRGRPRKTPTTTQRELELENNRLRMENELLRNFLQNTGRR